jgi:hypothetical protein
MHAPPPRSPAARALAGINARAPPTIVAAVTPVIPVLTEAVAASYVILIIVFIDNNNNIHRLTLKF